MAKSILGVHYVTAIAGDPGPNLNVAMRLFGVRLGCVGSSQITATSFTIPSGAGQYWRERLPAHSAEFEIPQERLGETLIASRDRCEASDIALVNCNPFVRDWITRPHSGK
jgi:hypothetical protein